MHRNDSENSLLDEYAGGNDHDESLEMQYDHKNNHRDNHKKEPSLDSLVIKNLEIKLPPGL